MATELLCLGGRALSRPDDAPSLGAAWTTRRGSPAASPELREVGLPDPPVVERRELAAGGQPPGRRVAGQGPRAVGGVPHRGPVLERAVDVDCGELRARHLAVEAGAALGGVARRRADVVEVPADVDRIPDDRDGLDPAVGGQRPAARAVQVEGAQVSARAVGGGVDERRGDDHVEDRVGHLRVVAGLDRPAVRVERGQEPAVDVVVDRGELAAGVDPAVGGPHVPDEAVRDGRPAGVESTAAGVERGEIAARLPAGRGERATGVHLRRRHRDAADGATDRGVPRVVDRARGGVDAGEPTMGGAAGMGERATEIDRAAVDDHGADAAVGSGVPGQELARRLVDRGDVAARGRGAPLDGGGEVTTDVDHAVAVGHGVDDAVETDGRARRAGHRGGRLRGGHAAELERADRGSGRDDEREPRAHAAMSLGHVTPSWVQGRCGSPPGNPHNWSPTPRRSREPANPDLRG